MGKLFKAYLSGPRVYACNTCATHLAEHEDIVSTSFHGRCGRAFLFSNVVNVVLGSIEERRLMTGLHMVADISCNVCNSLIGWKYLEAFEEREKYKENKYIIERTKIVEEKEWTG